MEHNFFFDASHTIYPQFLCCRILWFAEHYFLGVLESRISSQVRKPANKKRIGTVYIMVF
jgi:hypothetical protein